MIFLNAFLLLSKMEDWIKEQIKFGRTICLYDNHWFPIFKINPIKYKKSLLNFILDEYDSSYHLLADNKNMRNNIRGSNFYIYYPNQNNPIQIHKISSYLEEIIILLQTQHWSSLGKESKILPDELMDDIWRNFYSNLIAERINNFFNMIDNDMDDFFKNYYVYCLLIWMERNFDLLFSKLILRDRMVRKMLEKIDGEINGIRKRDYSFEANCPQFKELCRKWKSYPFFS